MAPNESHKNTSKPNHNSVSAGVKNPGHFNDQEVIIEKEKTHLKLETKKDISGLAISGGGIRSASFGLGVMQALVANNQLKRMDYMSTVSGGGYLGSALTWALKQGGAKVGTEPDNFPLGRRGGSAGKNDTGIQKTAEEGGNKLLDFIRQHSSYLAPTSALDMVSFTAVLLRSIIMSLFVYISFLTVLMTSSLWFLYTFSNGTMNKIQELIPGVLNGDSEYFNHGVLLAAGLGILVIMLIMGFFFSISTFSQNQKVSKLRYWSFIQGQINLGRMLKLSLTCFLLGSLPYVTILLGDIYTKTMTAGSSTLFGAVVGIWQYLKARKNEKNSGGGSDLMIYAGAFALCYGILLFSYILATSFFLDTSLNFSKPGWFIILIIAAIIFGFFVNLNLIGPHYVWRSRLMEAFMPNREAVKINNWEPASQADAALMENMCDSNNPRPYHIVNTNVILTNSPQIDYRGRGGDNFIISPLFCGSDATGWKTTSKFQNNLTRGITLASAMASSAAAMNPNAGVSGAGVTRNAIVSTLLSTLNLRLGYWTSNPSMQNTIGSPNFFVPGITSEILRTGFTENNKNMLISDGGHFENLALYELIRRRLSLIVVSDGGCDPGFDFDDLANAIEKVRVDFGTLVKFREDYKPDFILPGTAEDTVFNKKYELSKHGFAIADIKYDEKTSGVLVYIKLSMIKGLPVDVYSYKGANPTFPHQSTSDQFFDEKQFEAYRELGYYVGWQTMESAAGMQIFTNPEKLAKIAENEA